MEKIMFKNLLKQRFFINNVALLANIVVTAFCLNASNAFADDAHPDVDAKTSTGESVILHANGKWEYVNTQKAAKAKEIAIKLDPSANCPSGSQGMFLGLGRCILPGDKDYQTGSRSGKGFGH